MYRLITLIVGLVLGTATAFAQLERVDMIEPYEDCDIAVRPAVIDPAGSYAYFSMEGICRKIAKIDLSTFELVDTFELESNEILSLSAAVIDSEGRYAYVTTQGRPVGQPGTIIKIDLETFERVDTITLDSVPGENTFRSGIIDPEDHFAYFGNNYPDGKVLKVDLETFEVVDLLSLETLPYPSVALIDHDGHFAYFSSNHTAPGLVVKIDLETFEEVDTLYFEEDEIWPLAAAIDPESRFAYFGVINPDAGVGQVVKVDLEAFERVDAITLLEGEYDLTSAVIDPDGQFATFGMSTSPIAQQVVQIDLEKFERVESIRLDVGENFVESAVIDPEGVFAYFGANANPSPTHDRVVKVRLREPPERPANDDIAGAVVLTESGVYEGTNVNATVEDDVPVMSCGSGGRADVWWSFTLPVDGKATIRTEGSDFDTVLSLHAADDLSEIDCNDDNGGGGTWSLLEGVSVNEGQTYLIRIAGKNAAEGNIQFEVDAPFTVFDEGLPGEVAQGLTVPSPNPIRETATLTVSVEESQDVTITVLDVTGRRMLTLYDGALAGGTSKLLTLDASSLPAGAYVIRAIGENFSEIRQVTVVR